LNAPRTFEGVQVWDVVDRLGGQMRIAGRSVTGWDMGAALHLGAALGVSAKALAELLPPVEAVMVRKINQHIEASHE
jgi:hypothetical protein